MREGNNETDQLPRVKGEGLKALKRDEELSKWFKTLIFKLLDGLPVTRHWLRCDG